VKEAGPGNRLERLCALVVQAFSSAGLLLPQVCDSKQMSSWVLTFGGGGRASHLLCRLTMCATRLMPQVLGMAQVGQMKVQMITGYTNEGYISTHTHTLSLSHMHAYSLCLYYKHTNTHTHTHTHTHDRHTQDSRPVKLHATVINTRYAVRSTHGNGQRQQFDARLLLQKFGLVDFGAVTLPSVSKIRRTIVDRSRISICSHFPR